MSLEDRLNSNKGKLAQVIRVVIAVSLILFPLINFALEIPAIADVLTGSEGQIVEEVINVD